MSMAELVFAGAGNAKSRTHSTKSFLNMPSDPLLRQGLEPCLKGQREPPKLTAVLRLQIFGWLRLLPCNSWSTRVQKEISSHIMGFPSLF